MEQKRVSLEVAKAIKEAGYPQEQIYDYEAIVITDFDYVGKYLGLMEEVCYLCPTYFDVWVWLWREKGLRITTELTNVGLKTYINNVALDYYQEDDPEEAIEKAITYICENGLIK